MTHKYFVIIAFLFLSACQKPITFTPKLSDTEIHNEEIRQQQIVDKIKAQGGKPKAWKNHKNMRKQFELVGERIEKAGAKICIELQLQERGCYYYFRLNQNDELNSKADGKNIIIYTGMMRFIESDDELAVVMAHEFSHNLMNHVDAQKNNKNIGKIFGLAIDALASSQGLNTHGDAAEFEQEADYVGLYVMARAGYDIKKAGDLWRRMSIENPSDIYTTSTHPSNAARFVAIQKTIAEIEYKRKNHVELLPYFKI